MRLIPIYLPEGCIIAFSDKETENVLCSKAHGVLCGTKLYTPYVHFLKTQAEMSYSYYRV